ncbi:hypothetical protein BU23DRAFT_165870 [Bimuria novae-zelandiae CBS 107.79]|uniref:Zinc finger PHD-type domain-containing protein n=1 Tax=Bimuria novae-zelandiae CBS 107.79 TaxID=1447943 RepID=A0A6A5V3R0_9PLEO|nr:hypothetical protein BU23DRAFT_165870 [Bimuria novae-zelandiae CBS 107.79]
MGKAILFRWEDSDALKHHCGFCERPLSHPGARSSCFGPHAEPCHRYHQRMFMRNRGHTCDMCQHADEHHYKRHQEMCEQIRSIYESCGEDWPIIPDDEDDRGRSRSRGSDAFDSEGRSSISGKKPLKKRDKKEQKRQIRAASRTKVITQEEISYIHSVLHPAASYGNTENPNNPEEIEEIEQHLKYNAQCYNHGQKRSDIKQFAHVPDADIDFPTEMGRIFDILRIGELLKRNERNRGLRNKELVGFKALVATLQSQIINDLVLAKRDELEIRMRRAAFLRYTNRASFDIMANRYADKDWKTGEKIRPLGSNSSSSGSLTAVEEEDEMDESDLLKREEELRCFSTTTLSADADRRHIEHSHKKLRDDGMVEEVMAIKFTRDTPSKGLPKPPRTLKVVNPNTIPSSPIVFRNLWAQRSSAITKPLSVLKRSVQHLSTELPAMCPAPSSNDWLTVGEVANNKIGDAEPAHVQSSNSSSRVHAEAPQLVEKKSAEPASLEHAPVEPRKKKDRKKQREAERKARRVAEMESVAPVQTEIFSGDTEVDSPTSKLTSTKYSAHEALEEGSPVSPKHASQEEIEVSEEGLPASSDLFPSSLEVDRGGFLSLSGDTSIVGSKPSAITAPAKGGKGSNEDPLSPLPIAILPSIRTQKAQKDSPTEPAKVKDMNGHLSDIPLPTSKVARHKDWLKFASAFKVDGFSTLMFLPDHPAYDNCPFYDCPWEGTGTLDCPYHKSYCKCIDPLEPTNDKYIIYPGTEPCQIGPFNCIQSAKLMSFLEYQPETKGRLMLVEEDLFFWLYTAGRNWRVEDLSLKKLQNMTVPKNMPKVLMWEVDDYLRGYSKGWYLKQVDRFQELADKNERLRHRSCEPTITVEFLEIMRKKCETGPDDEAICYCKQNLPDNPRDDEGLVRCAYYDCPIGLFHHRCVEKLGHDKLSTWYCGSCERSMSIEAQKALHYTDSSYKNRPMPDVNSREFQPALRAVAALVDAHTMGYCERH